MPYTIRFALLPMGHAAGAAKDGESVSVQPTDFTSTEDGQRFIKSLEAFPNDVLQLLSQQCGVAVSPSQVDNLLVIVNKDLTATVYLNEVRQVLRVRASRTINAGEPVAKNDIADIDRMELGDISIAPEAGVLFLFSVGWRKGLFYDFAPLNPITVVRRHSIARFLLNFMPMFSFKSVSAFSNPNGTCYSVPNCSVRGLQEIDH